MMRSAAVPVSRARGESPAAFDGRCIPALGDARRANIPDILPPRAWIAGRLARLGATRHFHHGLFILGACALASAALVAQGPRNIQPLALDDRAGFEPMFDGSSLAGWEGDQAFWRVEGGLLIGESTAGKPLPANTFLIWTKAQPADFELKLDFKISAGNTGVQYRSARAPDVGPFVLKGYQADIDFANQWTGQLYEERGRGFLALPGQATSSRGDKPQIFGSPTPADAIKAAVNIGGWNTIHIIARGDLVVHAINGKVSAVFLDGDKARRPSKGFIGLQLHTGPPMKAEFRNLGIRTVE